MEVEAETGVEQRHAKEAKACWRPPESRREAGIDAPSEPAEGTDLTGTLILVSETSEPQENTFQLL